MDSLDAIEAFRKEKGKRLQKLHRSEMSVVMKDAISCSKIDEIK